ncbi:hypothetical protein MHC_02430 [Mycoplasma haemocanis str. Illinois]|uniref:Uncharacterized protein n=1 Tax=Mycoplasma haemocanis (strain Illinois) TaxID=1111676 RepID=H6N6S8_MYCHN|nr:hypothetical protein [Mycoplasma haemocanis]AEW45350.1 hypothetical protein MHC_02430 [Mycoplasma haemocanis str. Illinois]
MNFTSKLLIGSVSLGGTSMGAGVYALTSSGFRKTELSSEKECRFHELIGIDRFYADAFQPITKDEIKKRVEQEGDDFSPIETVCLANAGKDMFVSKKSRKWGYHDADQKDTTHQNKFKKYLEYRELVRR